MIRLAGFPALKTLEAFDWSAQPNAERLERILLAYVEHTKPIGHSEHSG